eukprot:COSAG01_NODE_1651_length_9623_cov_6.232045_5_plen_202_part_00
MPPPPAARWRAAAPPPARGVVGATAVSPTRPRCKAASRSARTAAAAVRQGLPLAGFDRSMPALLPVDPSKPACWLADFSSARVHLPENVLVEVAAPPAAATAMPSSHAGGGPCVSGGCGQGGSCRKCYGPGSGQPSWSCEVCCGGCPPKKTGGGQYCACPAPPAPYGIPYTAPSPPLKCTLLGAVRAVINSQSPSPSPPDR